MPRVNLRRQGGFFEEAAVKELKKRKYTILETNYRSRRAEVDKIARQGGVLVFVKEKARKKNTGQNPFEAVGPLKQKKIIEAAKIYMMKKNMSKTYVRFDVVGVVFDEDGSLKTEIIKDAFQAG